MNVYLEQEKENINKRIAEIEQNYKESGKNIQFVLVGDKSILKENQEEYSALLRMKEIINDNFNEKTKFEYLEEREKTIFPKLNDRIYNSFKNPEYFKQEEKERVERRIKQIISLYNMASKNQEFSLASNGQMVRRENKEEYEKLCKMVKMIDNNFENVSYYDYMDLRVETSLGQMSDLDYSALMGRENPKKRENSIPKMDMPNISVEPEPDLSNLNNVAQEETVEEKTKEQPVNSEAIPLGPGSEPVNGSANAPKDEPQKEEGLVPVNNVLNQNPTLDSPDVIVLPGNKGELAPRNKPTDFIDIEPVEEQESELVKVTKTTPFKWVSEHKKQILIAVGLTALTIAVIVALNQLIPAIVASMKASQISSLAAEMVTNGQMYFTASASEKLALHGANTGLADVVTSLSGLSNSFNTANGVWTIGTQTLSEFAASAAVQAEAAVSKVALLKGVTTGLSIGGLGALGTGLLLPKKKTQEYKDILNLIKDYNSKVETMTEEESKKTAQDISNKIINSNNLTPNEQSILFKKLQASLKKTNKNKPINNNFENENIEEVEMDNEIIDDAEIESLNEGKHL